MFCIFKIFQTTSFDVLQHAELTKGGDENRPSAIHTNSHLKWGRDLNLPAIDVLIMNDPINYIYLYDLTPAVRISTLHGGYGCGNERGWG